ncbi:MAG: hypothetical protein IPJ41_09360 [Phycisphaerales bacterium]|nr:hypothetical protein [Phycisphaerales bacterium]
MEIYRGRARRVASALNALASARHAQAHKLLLASKGLEPEFRSAMCPHCGATVDLTRQPDAPQLYCPYCDTLSANGYADPELRKFRLCAKCGYFGQPRMFTELYFYFLLVVYGYRIRQQEFCSSCMRGVAWRMLAFNAPFLVGVPVALTQLWRAYFGGSRSSPLFPLLESGNAAARAGKLARGQAIYHKILEQTSPAPGVRYNLALTSLRAGDAEGAILHLEEALADCANYAPGAALLRDTYRRSGHPERAAELDELWGVTEPTAADDQAAQSNA